jgi:histidinol dehydrogenase
MPIKIIRNLQDGKLEFSRGNGRRIPGTLPGSNQESNQLNSSKSEIEASVRRVLEDVRLNGDSAVRHYSSVFDGVKIENVAVDRKDVIQSTTTINQDLLTALKFSAARIRKYHEATKPPTWVEIEKGLSEKTVPLERVGIYVPGGTASYPSSVLMTAIPARVAGVDEIIMCTPSASPEVLAAADIAGVDRIFRIGGSQAIAAMAYGTESIPKVDMVCGPGNIYVTLAKKLVFGEVAIDGLYGPTEMVLLADATADPSHCAADMLAQAEHDPLASPILVTDSDTLVQQVQDQLYRQLERLDRKEVIEAALDHGGYIVKVKNIDEAVDLANFIAPEHVCLLLKDPSAAAAKIRHAGGLFIGQYSPEVVGDYVAGPSHVMPTGGTARFFSALGVHQFLRTMPIVSLEGDGFDVMADAVSLIARAEGLTAHAKAMEIRVKGREI